MASTSYEVGKAALLGLPSVQGDCVRTLLPGFLGACRADHGSTAEWVWLDSVFSPVNQQNIRFTAPGAGDEVAESELLDEQGHGAAKAAQGEFGLPSAGTPGNRIVHLAPERLVVGLFTRRLHLACG
jgi:hypothetical protein